MTLTLGIDPGQVCTGLALVDFGLQRRRLVEAHSVKDTSVGVWEFINDMCTRHEHIQVCGLEAYTWLGPRSANKNAMSFAAFIGEFRAHWTHSPIDDLIEIRKVEVNRAIGIRSGKVPKARVRAAIEALFPGAKFRNEHERDAAAVAVAAWQRVGRVGRKSA